MTENGPPSPETPQFCHTIVKKKVHYWPTCSRTWQLRELRRSIIGSTRKSTKPSLLRCHACHQHRSKPFFFSVARSDLWQWSSFKRRSRKEQLGALETEPDGKPDNMPSDVARKTTRELRGTSTSKFLNFLKLKRHVRKKFFLSFVQ